MVLYGPVQLPSGLVKSINHQSIEISASALRSHAFLAGQGALDPLNDAKGRAMQLKQLCSNVDVMLIPAGPPCDVCWACWIAGRA